MKTEITSEITVDEFDQRLDVDITFNEDGTYNQKSIDNYEKAELIKRELSKFKNDPKLFLHHAKNLKGKARKSTLKVFKYNGKYGVGYVIDIPDFTPESNIFQRRYYLFKTPQEIALEKLAAFNELTDEDEELNIE